MKILTITGTKRKGNSLLSAKYIAKKLDAELEILNMADLSIEPCKACYACLFGQKCMIEDDVEMVFERIESADAVLLIAPVYWLDLTGKIKMFLDRMFMALPYLKDFRSKKGAVVYLYGFEDLRGWASNTYNIFLRVLGIEPLAVVGINAALPGEVLKKGNLEKLDLVAEVIENGERVRFDYQCPVCLSEIFRQENGALRCPICRSKLDINLNVVEEGMVMKYEWMDEHYEWLRGMKRLYIEQREELAKLRDVYGV